MKIKSLEILNNPKVGNLKIDFTINNETKDTIIIAGNNGCGKTTILEKLHLLSDLENIYYDPSSNEILEFSITIEENDINMFIKEHPDIDFPLTGEHNVLITINFSQKFYRNRVKIYEIDTHTYFDSYDYVHQYKFADIINSFFSTANINYTFSNLSNITSIELDSKSEKNILASDNIGDEIKQTFIDIYNLDAQDFQEWAKNHIGESIDENKMNIRIKRFEKAFNYIMDDLKFEKVLTKDGHKQVIFKRNNKTISIDDLSSGEKQIIIRGGYLLRYQKSIQGNIILIDEPELSLHPEWQKKILQFYKNLFIDEDGKQTSQIFVATHSPFIIHNDTRYNDKVIILNRNKLDGTITIDNEPKYYNLNSVDLVESAFNISDFQSENNILFVEGETDKIYLEKAINLFFSNNVNFTVEWIGKYKNNNTSKAINTGKDGLNNLLKVLETNENLFNRKIGLLYDCDTNKNDIITSKYFTYILNPIQNKIYKIGIENQLELPSSFNYAEFYNSYTKIDEYGIPNEIRTLNKLKLCKYICNSKEVKDYLKSLEIVLNDIINLFNS